MKKFYYLAIAVLITAVSCSRDDLPFYQGGKVLFIHSPSDHVVISGVFSGPTPNDTITGFISIWLMGSNDSDTAVAYRIRVTGSDHEVFWGDNHTPSHVFESTYRRGPEPDTLMFRIPRTLVWSDTTYTFTFALETDPLYNAPTTSQENLFRQIHITIKDEYPEPTWWDDEITDYFGPFSSKKMRAFAHWQNWQHAYLTEDEYEMLGPQFKALLTDLAYAFACYLTTFEQAGSPFLDHDGKPVRLSELAYANINDCQP